MRIGPLFFSNRNIKINSPLYNRNNNKCTSNIRQKQQLMIPVRLQI